MRRNKAIRCSSCGFDLQPEDEIIINAVFLGTVHHVDCASDLPEQMIFDKGTYSFLSVKRAELFDLIRTM